MFIYTKLLNWEKLKKKSTNLPHLRGKLASDDFPLLQTVLWPIFFFWIAIPVPINRKKNNRGRDRDRDFT